MSAAQPAADRLPWLVLAVGVSCALHVGKLPVAIPALQASLDLTLLQAGFLLSLVQLAGMLLGLPVGLLADRLGPRRVMLAGLVLLAAGSAWGGLSPGATQLLLSRMVEGLGFLLSVLPAPGLLRERVHDGRVLSRALGWWGAYMPLGAALGLLLGNALIRHGGWRPVWLGLALVTLLAGLLLAWRVAPLARVTTEAGSPRWGPRLRRTLSRPGPWWLALAFFMYSGQWLAIIGFLPTIYHQAGYPPEVIGWLSALAAGVNLLGNVGAGRWLSRGVQPGRLLAGAYVTMGLSALIALGAGGPPALQYAAVLLFSGVGGLIPGTLFGLSVHLAPGQDAVSSTVGWMQQWSSLGQFLGPPLVAWVATQLGGWHATGWITGACSLAGVGLAWRLQKLWSGRPPA